MKKAAIGIGGLILISLAVIAIRLLAPQAVADAENGLSPFTAVPLNDGRNTGVLAPGEAHWYQFVRSGNDGAFQQQTDLTLFFTPDDGNRSYRVNFQIFPAGQITNWYWGDVSQMQNLGAGGVVSRDGNPVTGELLWSGWVVSNDTYYIQVFNGADVAIDYWLFTDNIIAAELGPSPEPPPAVDVSVEADPNPPLVTSPTSDVSVEADDSRLLPLASELQKAQPAAEPEAWDIPDGTPTRLVIPAIALDSHIAAVGWEPVVINGKTYKRWSTADSIVGWHKLSAKLGQIGNIVLNGHSDANAEVFRNLKYVEIGDEIMVFSGQQAYRYLVAEKTLVKEKDVSLEEHIQNARWIAPTQDERLTLVTCTNPGATHRLIVIARPLVYE